MVLENSGFSSKKNNQLCFGVHMFPAATLTFKSLVVTHLYWTVIQAICLVFLSEAVLVSVMNHRFSTSQPCPSLVHF